jgi:ADP-heptose:LPS heptosyltransferase
MCSDECYYPPFLSARTITYNPQKNIYLCESFEESITFFNKCELFISNDSGLVEFAKICGVNEVVILPNYLWLDIWPGLHLINPFGTKISWCVKRE